MKIRRIKIENFRSIKNVEFETTDFNIVVGQNNCGKTNFFESIEFFFNGAGKSGVQNELRHGKKEENEITVEIEFSGAQDGLEKMSNESNKTKIKAALGTSDTVTISRSSENPTKRKFLVNGEEKKPGTGFDTALNDFLPKFEYVNTKQYYDAVAKYTKNAPIGIMLSGVVSTILQENQHYKEFQQTFKELFENDNSEIKTQFESIGNKVRIHLEKQFPDCTNVKFEVTAPIFDDLLKNFSTTVDDGIETSADDKGDGMQRALMLAIIHAYADYRKEKEDVGKSFLFFIDEAELHLHPTAQRNLKTVLHSLSTSNDQVFINTHSSVFVADELPNQAIFKAEKNNGETTILRVDELQKPYIVYELLGGSPSDLLLPRNFLIVEGKSEVEFLSRVINRFYRTKPSIQIIQAKGNHDQTDKVVNAIDKAFSPLQTSIYKDKIIILTDKPSIEAQAGFSDFLQKHKNITHNNQIFILPVRDIEQYYPNQTDPIYGNWKKTQMEIDAEKEKGKKNFTSEKKVKLAIAVGNNITQKQFEGDMNVCYDALQKCWDSAFAI